ncbi:MAG: PQQ-binding-like beta-propeller repeat protein [bacterium]
MRYIVSLALTLGLALIAFAAIDPGNAFISLTLKGAQPADMPVMVELATTEGVVTVGYAGITKADVSGLTWKTPKLAGNLKVGADVYKIDAKLTDEAFAGTVTGATLTGTITGSIRSKRAPYGGRDFYPSATNPVGFRGDGNGYFPGATPVTEWSEGTAVKKSTPPGAGNKVSYWDFTDDKTKNIVWKAEMPSWGNNQPVVVGDRIFVTGEPDLLICVDANTGKVLWTRENNPWMMAGVEKELAGKLREMYQIRYALTTFIGIQFHFTTCGRYFTNDKLKPIVDPFIEKGLPRMLAALKELDPAGGYEAPAKQTEDALNAWFANNYTDKQAWEYEKKLNGLLVTRIDKRINDLSKKKVLLGIPWGNMVGLTMPTPVSDGQHVYVSFSQGQTACYDLDGNLVWSTYFDQFINGSRTSQIQSPLIVGDILVDMHGYDKLRGLNKNTGKLVWEAPAQATDAAKGGGHYVGTHKIMTLKRGDKSVDVIVTTLCNIIRASDGEVLGYLPYESVTKASVDGVETETVKKWGPSGGPSICNSGDIVYKGANGDAYSGPMMAFRLAWDGADKVTATKLWDLGPKTVDSFLSNVATPTMLIARTPRSGNVFDAETGKVIFNTGNKDQQLGLSSNLQVGNYFLSCNAGDNLRQMSEWRSRRQDGKTLLPFYVADITNLAQPKQVSTNILGGINMPRMPYLEKYLPEQYTNDDFWNAQGGKPAHFMNTDTSIFPAGNRIFIRSVSHLYCIGDPTKAYDWNPASRPATAAK